VHVIETTDAQKRPLDVASLFAETVDSGYAEVRTGGKVA